MFSCESRLTDNPKHQFLLPDRPCFRWCKRGCTPLKIHERILACKETKLKTTKGRSHAEIQC